MRHSRGITRELVGQEFPLVVSAEIAIPDQGKIMRSYKRRLLRGAGGPEEISMAVSRSASRLRSHRSS